MSKVFILQSKQLLPATLDEVWQFFSDARNLLAITPPHLNLKVTNKVYGDRIYAGQVMTYTVRPLLSIPISWMTEITQMEEKKYFIDEQRQGPYKLWHHQHHFKQITNGVEMTDIIHYRLPLPFFSSVVNTLLVKKELAKIFLYRYQKINELFGQWPGQQMNLQLS